MKLSNKSHRKTTFLKKSTAVKLNTFGVFRMCAAAARRFSKVSKSKINYWIDIIIAIGFLLSALSGIVLNFAPSGGFQGGRNAFYGREVLFLNHNTWDVLHTWSSFVMIAGVFLHLVLHWKWIVCMTKKLFKRQPESEKDSKVCAVRQ